MQDDQRDSLGELGDLKHIIGIFSVFFLAALAGFWYATNADIPQNYMPEVISSDVMEERTTHIADCAGTSVREYQHDGKHFRFFSFEGMMVYESLVGVGFEVTPTIANAILFGTKGVVIHEVSMDDNGNNQIDRYNQRRTVELLFTKRRGILNGFAGCIDHLLYMPNV